MLIYSSSVRDLWHHSEFVQIKVKQCKALVLCVRTGENILEIARAGIDQGYGIVMTVFK